MTRLARRRESGGDVIGVPGALIVGPVAAVAVAGRAGVDVVFMAGAAGQRRMHALEREERGVVEMGLAEGCVRGPVAGVAGRREPGGDVIGVPGALIIGPVTAVAIAGRAGVDIVFMAGAAGQRCVHALEREDRGVVEGGLLPARLRGQVAELALR